jgi:hypothetical protein
MNIAKLLLILAVAGGYHYWKTHNEGATPAGADASITSENGFVALPPMEGGNTDAVMVVAAENCPHEDAQRADGLAQALSEQGIPVVRTHNVSFNQIGSSEEAGRITSIMNGRLPVVFVRGRAKSNPALEEVIAEYKAE